MDYNKLCLKGIKYVASAYGNWKMRKYKLKSAADKANTAKEFHLKAQANRLISELENREKAIAMMFLCYNDKKRQLEIEAQNQIILLECPSMTCRCREGAANIGTHLKDYEPGKFKCEACGSEMIPRDSPNMDIDLVWLGVKTSLFQ